MGAWLTWLRCQSAEALPAVRMDMLIKRTAPGAAEVFTLEITELGFSMLAWLGLGLGLGLGFGFGFGLGLGLGLGLGSGLGLGLGYPNPNPDPNQARRPAHRLRCSARVVPRRHGGYARGGGARPQPRPRPGGRRRRRRAERRGWCELEHR